jgi:hypothetical protein
LVLSPFIIVFKELLMGLTIHYALSTDRTEVESVRSLVQEFRRLAQHIPFQEVGEIVEFEADACQYEGSDDSDRWLKIQAGQLAITRPP